MSRTYHDYSGQFYRIETKWQSGTLTGEYKAELRDFLIYKDKRYFNHMIGEAYHIKRSGEKISRGYEDIIFQNISSCDEFLVCGGKFKEEGNRVALILKNKPDKTEMDKISKAIDDTIPIMYMVNIFVLPYALFQKAISDNSFLNTFNSFLKSNYKLTS